MALGENFYNEIFEREQKWIESIDSNLLNSVYCNLTLKPFYLEKRKELKEEYNKTNNEIIKQTILTINDIIDKIELFNYEYLNYKKPNMNLLLPLFLTTKMNNIAEKEYKHNETQEEIDRLQIRKQILVNEIGNYDRVTRDELDYVYDDFPEEIKRVK